VHPTGEPEGGIRLCCNQTRFVPHKPLACCSVDVPISQLAIGTQLLSGLDANCAVLVDGPQRPGHTVFTAAWLSRRRTGGPGIKYSWQYRWSERGVRLE
jgi:hypothetical protein